MYTRKTRDEWQLLIDYGYGYGYEYEIAEDTLDAIRQRAKEYRENMPQYPVKIVKRRIKLETVNA